MARKLFSQQTTDDQSLKVQKETAQNTKETAEELERQTKQLSNFTADNIADMAVTLGAQIYSTGREALDLTQQALIAEVGPVNQNIQAIREMYGGFARDIDFNYMAESASSNALKRYMVLSDSYAEISNKSILGSVKTGEQVLNNISDRGNILENLIGDPKEVFSRVDSILADLSTTFGDEISKLSEEQVVKMAFYEETLGTSASTLQNIFQKQIGFTGEMSTDVLDKLGAYAANLSNELNIPMKTLTGMTTQMMSNTQMFGDITVEEATRMSAKLTQLGVTMEQLNQQQSKFGSFQGAAQAAGTIAQLTGAQVDAMKMSFLASEGRFDELIDYQRESLMKAGFTKEKFLNQSNAMRNAIADSFGRSQEEMALLLDKNRRISSQEELDAIMKEGDVAEEDGFERLLDNVDQTQRAMDTLEDRIKRTTQKAQMASTEAAVTAMMQQARVNEAQLSALDTLAKDVNIKRIEGVLTAVGDMYKAIDPERFAGTAQEMLDTLTKKASEEGGFFDRMQKDYERFDKIRRGEDDPDPPAPSDPQQKANTAQQIVQQDLAGGTKPTVNVNLTAKSEVVVQGDKTFVKTVVEDAQGKIIKTVMEEVKTKYVEKSE